MTVGEEASEAGELAGKVWRGPPVGNVEELVGAWRSLGHYLFHKLEGEFADTTLFTDFASGRSWTGGQLRAKIANVACALIEKHNFKPKTVVCISYDNSDHLFILACGVICAGGTVACHYSRDPYAELLYLTRKVEAKLLFCHHRNANWAKRLTEDMGYPIKAIAMDRPQSAAADEDESAAPPKSGDFFEDLLWHEHTKSKWAQRVPVECGDLRRHLAVITMSSGTSGRPKAVAQTHWNALAELVAGGRSSLTRGLNFACCASLDYVSGRLILFGAIHTGYRAIILNGFQPRTLLEACERYKVHIIYLGAASFYNLITHKHLEHYDLSSVRAVFPMGAEVTYLAELANFFARHPHVAQVRQGFGASELSGGAMNSMTPGEYLRDPHNCGRLLPGMRARIVDPATGKSLGPNQVGILHIRGETVFPGYYDCELARQRRARRLAAAKATENNNNNNVEGDLTKNVNEKEAASKACEDSSEPSEEEEDSPFVNDANIFDAHGFYISGDYAHFNDQEQLFIRGRQKELMSCRGAKKVLPQELEAVIGEHPAVHKVCVLGVASKREPLLHCPRAFVVAKAACYDPARPLELGPRLSTLNGELEEALEREPLLHGGNAAHELNGRMEAGRRRRLAEDLMQFVNERVGWEKQLTGGIVLLDDIPTSRATGKFNKNYLRALTPDRVEIYGDRSD